ncbi:hypothetical protein EA462_04795 [Natrarchaeobius halalkaliphilus]|uniref:Uncharacterized protein n=1 Tax=Natrarchaeobius halalkaliphilus TaxID=1679091 RepID=A0A3N6LS33_9EURY|nr:hypothetical protein [Natrarchaeobius halalkaliphilus]RQG91307.1 hypothetical protein EA462_04795 [Natrarchaeobius halalkaliphilus]
MSHSVPDVIETILESVEDDVADPDLRYKIRTARQLLVLVDEQHTVAKGALEESGLEEDTRERLEQLGYLE